MQWPIDTSAFAFMGSLPPEPLLDHLRVLPVE